METLPIFIVNGILSEIGSSEIINVFIVNGISSEYLSNPIQAYVLNGTPSEDRPPGMKYVWVANGAQDFSERCQEIYVVNPERIPILVRQKLYNLY